MGADRRAGKIRAEYDAKMTSDRAVFERTDFPKKETEVHGKTAETWVGLVTFVKKELDKRMEDDYNKKRQKCFE